MTSPALMPHFAEHPVLFLALSVALYLAAACTSVPVQAQVPLASETAAEIRGGGTQSIRARLVQDDGVVGGTLTIAIEARTEGLVANTFASATIDVGFDPVLLSPSGSGPGVLGYANTPYAVSPSIIGGGTVFRLTITSQSVGTGGFPDRDGYEIGSTFEPIATASFTIDAAFDATDFFLDCQSLSVGFYDTQDNSSGSGTILDNSTGAVPMVSVRPLALRTLDLTVDEGWRTLSGLPGMSVDNLVGDLSTRGFPGADSETGFPNVWRWDEASGWVSAASQAEEIPATGGVAFFALAADLPASVRLSGPYAEQTYSTGSPASCAAGPIPFDVSYTANDPPAAGSGWNLAGNPTAATLDWTAAGWTRTSLGSTAYVYDAVSDQYLTNNATTGTFDGLIAPLQGFWVRAIEDTPPPDLVAPEAALTTGGTFYGRSAPLAIAGTEGGRKADRRDPLSSARGSTIALRLEGEVQGVDRWAAVHVSFQAGGEAGLDRYDAEALAGLGNASIDLYTVLDDGTALEIDARPLASLAPSDRGGLKIPLAVAATAGAEPVGGKFALSLTDAVRLPAELRIVLVDTETGTEVDLLTVPEYTFEVPAKASANGDERPAAAQTRAKRAHDALSVEASAPGDVSSTGTRRRQAPTSEVSAMRAPEARRGEVEAARFLLRLVSTEAAGDDAIRSTSGTDRAAKSTSGADVSAAARGSGPSIPDTYVLDAVYPNPFSARATVRYGVPEAAAVWLAVYDLLGRRVTVLVDRRQEAGYHSVEWNAGDLPNGVYVLRLTSGEHAFSKRLTLLK